MGGYCTKAAETACGAGGCGFSCQCHNCSRGNTCDCSCRWLVVGGMALTAVAGWIATISYRERRRWLCTWSSIYAVTGVSMTIITYLRGPDPHDVFGCSLPFSLWLGSLFITTLSYVTTDYIKRDSHLEEKPERYVYDPNVGEYVLKQQLSSFRVS